MNAPNEATDATETVAARDLCELARLGEIVARINAGERFRVQHDDGNVAIVSVEDLELLESIDARLDEDDARDCARILADSVAGKTQPYEPVRVE